METGQDLGRAPGSGRSDLCSRAQSAHESQCGDRVDPARMAARRGAANRVRQAERGAGPRSGLTRERRTAQRAWA
jgi:hypothetical protein